MAGGSPAFGER